METTTDSKERRGYSLCHPDRKFLARGLCSTCYQRWKKDKTGVLQNFTEQFALAKTARINSNIEKQINRIDKRRRGKQWRFKTLFSRYGLDENAYNTLLLEQNNLCAVCKLVKPEYVDHNHKTGIVRGLVCPKCNTLVGYLETSQHILGEAINYMLTRGVGNDDRPK